MIKKLIFGLLIIVVLFLVGKNVLIKFGAKTFVAVKSKMSLDMSKFKLSFLSSNVDIEKMELFNSSSFSNERMISIPKIYVDLSLPKLLAGEMYFKNIQFDLEEFVLVRNKEGKLSLSELQSFSSKGDKEKSTSKEDKKDKKTSLYIESLELGIGNVIFKDYTTGDEPEIKVFKVGMKKKFKNVGNIKSLASLIGMEIMARTSLSQLANIDMSGLVDATNATVSKGMDVSRESVNKGADAAKKAVSQGLEASKDVMNKSSEEVSKMEEKAKKSIDEFQEKLNDFMSAPAE